MADGTDIFALSDEDFLNSPSVPPVAAETPVVEPAPAPAPVEPTETPAPVETPVVAVATEEVSATPAEIVNPLAEPDSEFTAPAKSAPASTEAAPKTDGTQQAQPATSADATKDGADATTKTAVAGDPTYEAFYKKVMTPFQANGRTVELKTPEEAIQLMQMGANYTKKMQELAPVRKIVTMLQNNELLDEGKLSFLIDLSKKDPEAIKKLVKDAGIDPMDIDTSVEPAYRAGNHRVSDEEVAFRSTLDDIQSTPEGKETIKVIHGSWDQVSKDAIWKNPAIMATINEQRGNGIYGRVVAEVERRRMLGQIQENIPFLQAYQVIGNELAQANAFADLAPKPAVPAAPPVPVATRVAAPKPVVANGDRVAAASQTRSTPGAVKEVSNPLAMSDADFEKRFAQFQGRV